MPLNGLVVPAVSLFGDRGNLDLAKNTRYVRGLIDDGVHHILSLGVPGEGASMSPAEREQLLEKVVESCTFGTDVWAGVDAATHEEAVAFADMAESAGAAVLAVLPPRGGRVEPAHVLERFRTLRAQTKLSMVAYHHAEHGASVLTLEVLRKLIEEQAIDGVLDASGSLGVGSALLEGASPGTSIFGGDGRSSVEGLSKGALGLVWEAANVLPRLASQIWEAHEGDQHERLATLSELQEVVRRASLEAPRPSSLKFLARYLREVDEGYRAPHGPLTPEQQAKVLSVVEPHKAALQEFA